MGEQKAVLSVVKNDKKKEFAPPGRAGQDRYSQNQGLVDDHGTNLRHCVPDRAPLVVPALLCLSFFPSSLFFLHCRCHRISTLFFFLFPFSIFFSYLVV